MNFDEILPPHCSTVAFVCGSIVFADNWTRSNRKWHPDSCCCQTSGERFVVNLHHFNPVVSPSALENASAAVTTTQRGVNYRVSVAAVRSANGRDGGAVITALTASSVFHPNAALCCQENPQSSSILALRHTFPCQYQFLRHLLWCLYCICITLVSLLANVLRYWFGDILAIQLRSGRTLLNPTICFIYHINFFVAFLLYWIWNKTWAAEL